MGILTLSALLNKLKTPVNGYPLRLHHVPLAVKGSSSQEGFSVSVCISQFSRVSQVVRLNKNRILTFCGLPSISKRG